MFGAQNKMFHLIPPPSCSFCEIPKSEHLLRSSQLFSDQNFDIAGSPKRMVDRWKESREKRSKLRSAYSCFLKNSENTYKPLPEDWVEVDKEFCVASSDFFKK